MKQDTPIDWVKVECLQSNCFYGLIRLEPEETALLMRALKEDPQRYRAFREELQLKYATSMRGC
jgi:hypothetical protein